MERKDFIRLITITTGATLVGGEFFLNACKNPASAMVVFSEKDIQFLDEVAETILPRTSTPGAKDAKVGEFMKIMVTDCYKADEQKVFKQGIEDLNAFSKEKTGKSFLEASPEERENLLKQLDNIAAEFQKEKATKEKDKREEADKNRHLIYNFPPDHYYTMMKQLTLLGYFTSEEGMTKALRYEPVPGKWLGVVDYKKGDKDWARY